MSRKGCQLVVIVRVSTVRGTYQLAVIARVSTVRVTKGNHPHLTVTMVTDSSYNVRMATEKLRHGLTLWLRESVRSRVDRTTLVSCRLL